MKCAWSAAARIAPRSTAWPDGGAEPKEVHRDAGRGSGLRENRVGQGAKHHIHLVCLEPLPRTHLDGAALQLADGTPVIGLTLRYDRVDNFWFCLLHELAHALCPLRDRACRHRAKKEPAVSGGLSTSLWAGTCYCFGESGGAGMTGSCISKMPVEAVIEGSCGTVW